ncbi:MAG: N-acetyl-gamma-glutamyl-phosphate reductase [Candidatus Sumerlaeia bacterium]|nr:N-acetyl-gamma-glutamyl-phosphate reductase [Candidatus Sumerlaeia bacterium]
MAKVRVGIAGATSYTARELIGRLAGHSTAELTCLMARVDKPVPVASSHPGLRGRTEVPIVPLDGDRLASDCDLAFLCLPHGPAAEMTKGLVAAGRRVIDLSADFRFPHRALYEQTYRQPHPAPDLIERAVYGLPELWREKIRSASLIANPGCYPTAVLLALAPLLRAYPNDIPAAGVVADCKSGVSGAGRTLSERAHFVEANEALTPYGVASHRHGPEIDSQLRAWSGTPIHVTFIPHLVPMDRGLCATVCVPMRGDLPDFDEVQRVYAGFCAGEPFLRHLPAGEFPGTKPVAHTNFADISVTADPQANLLIVMSAIDNLVKGASGQALQCMNLMLGCDETEGLL